MSYWEKQVVLVTGASRGIGAELARRFASLGAKVAINYSQSKAKAEEVLKQCDNGSGRVKLYQADVGIEGDVVKMMAAIEKELGRVTVLINNAGQTRDNLLMLMTTEEWRSVMSTHLDGAFFCSRAVLRGMVAERRGKIINISSISGIRGIAGQCNYSAAKAGLFGFTRALSREMGKKKITCNAVALGAIDTEMTQVLAPDIIKEYVGMTSLNRLGKTSEVADLLEFLASEKADYITGQVITLDGGMA